MEYGMDYHICEGKNLNKQTHLLELHLLLEKNERLVLTFRKSTTFRSDIIMNLISRLSEIPFSPFPGTI